MTFNRAGQTICEQSFRSTHALVRCIKEGKTDNLIFYQIQGNAWANLPDKDDLGVMKLSGSTFVDIIGF